MPAAATTPMQTATTAVATTAQPYRPGGTGTYPAASSTVGPQRPVQQVATLPQENMGTSNSTGATGTTSAPAVSQPGATGTSASSATTTPNNATPQGGRYW